MSDIEEAERLGGVRAAFMAVGAAMLLIIVGIEFGFAVYGSANGRGWSWIVLVVLWTLILWNGGGLRLRANVRALLNDELSRENRGKALETGFFVAILSALALFVVQTFVPMTAGDALKVVSACALAAALIRYSWLERR